MVFTAQEEAVLKKLVAKTILEMKIASARDSVDSNTFTLQNNLTDATAALKTECNK